MDLRQLRYFIALNEHRSFVRAADAMGITQPAFSRSIQGLEQEFGCVLVDRGNKDLRPTPEGQVVLQHALSLVQGAALLSSEVTQMTKLDAGELRFGCGPAPAVKLVPDAVAQFTGIHPKVRICLEVDNWEKLSRSLSREEIEFFIADIRHFEADPNFQTQPLTPKRGVFFCRPGHPLLAKESLSTNDMFDYPLATTLIPPGIRKLLANLSGRIDFSPTIQTEHFPALVKIVRQSNAIGVGTEEAFVEDIEQGSLALLHWRNLPQNIESMNARCGIVSRTGFRLSPAARKMIEVLVAVDRQQVSIAS
ncbi:MULTISPECIES: LysR family transcriptional regulator [Pseudomonas]|uniref:LysR family transcriptional regulator n=3 Tax=Pseudomonas chlororaphis TaxID=587753 RepID=A0AAP9VV06_9PSED|nr:MULTISPECIES: LysR family transcriptional regulator [Pseudomonas]AIC17398.1 transcriptional regulator [Pseudomonas chlororaphis]AUG38524.1 LysR family transcriptional regulator [Pseudomonas chlororaphis]AZD83086.1 LysR family transcriptional regulator [Pseudomonas chlororaphis subsp. aureofaciens]AZD89677.1 LysR family transcriptional regulator [Pseudomonas chlororaphis subsp. aureofaciens]AZD96127.1 LysR family transcriptional regulator [Pseudomonas chlororaphis subsp. aureofaciens]